MKKKMRRNKTDKNGYEYHFDGSSLKGLSAVKDKSKYLPSPEEIAKSLQSMKMTIMIDQPIVDFFKAAAKKHDVSYQQMIREVLRNYMMQSRNAA